MAYVLNPAEVKAAKGAHELFMVNLGALLLLGPMTIFLGIGRLGLLIPMLFSAAFMLYTVAKIPRAGSWFAQMHWRLALRNYRWLFLGFAITALLLGVSWLVESTGSANSPSQFLALALVRIGVMPSIIMVFACFVIENGALNQVLRHEVPERLAQAYPPPETLTRTP